MKLSKKVTILGACLALLISVTIFMAIYFNSRSSADDFTLEMTETSVNLKVGEQKDLKIEVNRNEAEISYITTSSTNAITVTKTNDCLHITATNEGSASIVVKAKYKGETKTARCDIIVSKLSVFDIEITDTQNCEFVNNTLNCFENSISFSQQNPRCESFIRRYHLH